MLHRAIGTTGVDASILGFGCMRLPVIGGKSDAIDYEVGTELLRHAIPQIMGEIKTMFGQ